MEELIIIGESDLPKVAELFRDAFSGEPWNNDWSDDEQLNAYIREISGSFNALNYGLLIDGKLSAVSIGMLRHWWEGTTYITEELFVTPGLQGRGIGSRFIGMIEEDIIRRGACGIFLQTDNDKPSYEFYMKNGFKELTNHVCFYKNVK